MNTNGNFGWRSYSWGKLSTTRQIILILCTYNRSWGGFTSVIELNQTASFQAKVLWKILIVQPGSKVFFTAPGSVFRLKDKLSLIPLFLLIMLERTLTFCNYEKTHINYWLPTLSPSSSFSQSATEHSVILKGSTPHQCCFVKTLYMHQEMQWNNPLFGKKWIINFTIYYYKVMNIWRENISFNFLSTQMF